MERQRTMTVMQQIEDLKNWHKQQERLFKNKQLQNQEYKGGFTTKTDSEFSALKSIETNLPNNSKEIPNKINEGKPFDEIPIKPSYSDINKMLNNDGGVVYETNGSKPKRKFLKKGEGIARFRMTPIKPQIRKSKSFQTKQTVKDKNCNSNEDKVNRVTDSKQIRDGESLISKNITKISEETIPFSWKNYLSSMLAPANDNGYSNLENSVLTDLSNHSLPESFFEKITAVKRKNAKEKEEVKVFEMLEQRALDSSFCSTSSMIVRLMENSIKSTPIKEKPSPINEQLHFDQDELGQFDKDKTSESGFITENQVHEDQSLHVRFRDENSYKSFTDYPNTTKDESKTSKNNYFGDNTHWSDCDCSTQYSSSDEDTRPISPPSCDQQNIVTVQIKANNKKVGDIILNTLDQNGKPLENTKVNNRTLKDIENNDRTYKNKEECDDLISNCGKKLQGSELHSQSTVINLRLKELEDEIEIFRKENAKLKKVKSDFEQEYKLLKNDKKTFYLQIEEEKKKHYEFLEEEKQKLAKEKLVFEKYTRNLNKNPNKEERKEIQILKEQLAAMKEELIKKESRWGAAQARVRNQVKMLEEDNKKLKQEIEVIRKSQKVNTLKNERKSNSHLLHAISQQLTKISPKDIAETFSVKDVSKSTDTKPVGNKKAKKHHQSNKTSAETLHDIEDLSSGSEFEFINTVEKKNSLERDIKKTVEEALFEPIMSAFNTRSKILLSDKELAEGPVNEDKTDDVKSVPADEIIEERTNQEGNKEIYYNDGRREIRYKNGNIKRISPNGDIIKIVYFNGDVKEICKDGIVKYYYGESRIWHTTYPDGLEILDFPSGQVERRHLNGTIEILYPNGCRKLSYTNGSEEWVYKDGTVLKVDAEKQKILTLPNGQKEIHTKEHKRREYPDGTVKLVYPDGTQETRYSSGRIRLKDQDGNLVMDSGSM